MFGEVFPYINLLPMFIIFMIIFIGIVIALIYLDTALCLTDPTDPIIYEERLKYQQELCRTNNENSNDQIISKISKFNKIDTRDYINSDFIYVCDICLTHVQNKTKHCRECNRCVSGFDHHCKWLNNCIGDKNYKKFMTLIILYFSSNIYLLIMYIIHLSNILKYWSKPFNQYYSPIIKICTIDCDSETDRYIMLTICCIMILFKLVCCILNGHLITMHIWLYYTNQTTYEWIMKKKKSRKIQDNPNVENSKEDEEEAPNSQGILSRGGSKPSSLNLYRSKIVHRIKTPRGN